MQWLVTLYLVFRSICSAKQIFNFLQAIRLQGHHRKVSALKFAEINNEISLVTASSDYAIIWHLNEVITNHQSGTILNSYERPVLYLVQSADGDTAWTYQVSSRYHTVLISFSNYSVLMRPGRS